MAAVWHRHIGLWIAEHHRPAWGLPSLVRCIRHPATLLLNPTAVTIVTNMGEAPKMDAKGFVVAAGRRLNIEHGAWAISCAQAAKRRYRLAAEFVWGQT